MKTGRESWSLAGVCVLVAGLMGGCTAVEQEGDMEEAPAAHYAAGAEVQDANGRSLGTVAIDSPCDPAVQDDLGRGLALLHNMTYSQAAAAFQAAADADPECALAHWGVAMTFVHPLWPDVVPAERLAAGLELLEEARTAEHRSASDDLYIDALAAYYGDGEGHPEPERLEAFQAAWADAHQQLSEDPEAALFYALATIATASPSDKSYDKQRQGGALAEEVLASVPNHPGAHHYVIHAYDVPPLAEQALPVARNYGKVSPENSHALHMTSHIFTRRGLWPESIEYNQRAEKAARERIASGAISMHRLHAYDYLAYAYLQRAEDEAAKQVLVEMEALEPPFQSHAGTAYSFAAVPARLALERHDWEAAVAVPTRWPEELDWDKFPHLDAIGVFANGLGAARSGDVAGAEAAIERLAELEEAAAGLPGAYDWGIQVAIQRAGVEAWLVYETADTEAALELMARAAEMEMSTEKNPVTPGEVLPARELYGDMLLAEGRFEEALAEYEGALARSPNRLNSLYGAAQASEGAGDAQTAAGYYQQLLEIAPQPTGEHPELDKAREVVG